MIALAEATDNAEHIPDPRRLTESDPDFLRLHARTQRKLMGSIRQAVRDVRASQTAPVTQRSGLLNVAVNSFVQRHLQLLKAAYEDAHVEGQIDYWHSVSNQPGKQQVIPADSATLRRRLAFYAPSVAKMVRELTVLGQGQRLVDLDRGMVFFNPNHDSHGRFTYGSSFTKGHTPEEIAAAHGRVAAAQERARNADAEMGRQTRRLLQAGAGRGPAGYRIRDEERDAQYNAAAREMDNSLNALRTAYSNAETMHSAEEVDAASRKIFGRTLSEEEYRSLVGAPKNADVTVSTDGEKLLIHTEGPAGRNATFFHDREVYTEKGQIVLHNDYFMVDGKTGKGFGTQVFANQVEGAQRLGVSKIVTLAAREEGLFNGYYTWPRLGYDASLPRGFRASIPESTGYRGFTRVSQFMKTSAGRNWWKMFGIQMDMTFSLRAGSRSLRVLKAYRAAKAAAKGKK